MNVVNLNTKRFTEKYCLLPRNVVAYIRGVLKADYRGDIAYLTRGQYAELKIFFCEIDKMAVLIFYSPYNGNIKGFDYYKNTVKLVRDKNKQYKYIWYRYEKRNRGMSRIKIAEMSCEDFAKTRVMRSSISRSLVILNECNELEGVEKAFRYLKK